MSSPLIPSHLFRRSIQNNLLKGKTYHIIKIVLLILHSNLDLSKRISIKKCNFKKKNAFTMHNIPYQLTRRNCFNDVGIAKMELI